MFLFGIVQSVGRKENVEMFKIIIITLVILLIIAIAVLIHSCCVVSSKASRYEDRLMEKKIYTEEEKETIHKGVSKTISSWPEWKRKVYDDQFAQSQYANKYLNSSLNKEDIEE